MRHNAIRNIFFLFILTQLPSPEQERQLGSQGTGYDSFLPFEAVFSCQKRAYPSVVVQCILIIEVTKITYLSLSGGRLPFGG